MVLRENFEIPARFSFRPFSVRWEICDAELLGWGEEPRTPFSRRIDQLSVDRERVEVYIWPDSIAERLMMVSGIRFPERAVELYRDNVPKDVLPLAETRRSRPDISGKRFKVLVCSRPEFKSSMAPSGLRPVDRPKDAWAMRDEFLSLEGGDGDQDEWIFGLQQFLNRWGMWNYRRGFGTRSGEQAPGFVLAFPHLLWQERNEYRKALEQPNKWLRTAAGSLSTTRMVEEWPYFLVERSYCDEAIRSTITINHLRKQRFGFCKRCGKQFERETAHKKSFCSRRCINAANVENWRKDQQKIKREKGGTRDAKG
jgi:endogenous inhibitor of DNA gyrase (YacG/DUF329 family)